MAVVSLPPLTLFRAEWTSKGSSSTNLAGDNAQHSKLVNSVIDWEEIADSSSAISSFRELRCHSPEPAEGRPAHALPSDLGLPRISGFDG